MDFLNEFTKKELILWIKNKSFFGPVKKSELMSIRYDLKYEELQLATDESRQVFKTIKNANANELVKKFNSTTDALKKMKIAEQLQAHQKALDDWWEVEQRISKMWDKHYKYHDLILKQMKKEEKEKLKLTKGGKK